MQINLTQDQALTLLAVLDRVGGTWGMLPGQAVTARKYAEEVRRELMRALRVDDEWIDGWLGARFEAEGHIWFVGVAE